MTDLDPILAKEMAAMLRRSAGGNRNVAAVAAELEKVSVSKPGAGAVKKPIDVVGMIGRAKELVTAGTRYVISGVKPTTWFSPSQPMEPMADQPDQGTKGRRFDYPVGVNLQTQPKTEQGSGIGFPTLRGLAEAYDLLRLIIETRKDQVSAYRWQIAPADEEAEKGAHADEVKRVTAFFKRPNPDQSWREFIRAVVEDDSICGSVALYPRRTLGGEVISLTPVDVATIKLLIDEFGNRPISPSPAFQQVLKGVPATDLTREDLQYWMRNQRTWKLYGYSPVEQVIITVNIALRRQAFLLEYYTEGSIPDAILGVPESWSPEQIKEFQTWWDSTMSGQTGERRKLKFMPEVKNVILPKDTAQILTDATDEWLARILCFAFSISPTALLKMVNRAAGEEINLSAKEDGTLPLIEWLGEKFTDFIQDPQGLNAPNVRWAWKVEKEVDPKIAAEIRQGDVKAGIVMIDEARESIGRAPVGITEPLVYTASGYVPIKESLDRQRKDFIDPPAPPPAFGAPGEGDPKNPKAGDGGAPGGTKGGAAPASGKKKVPEVDDAKSEKFVIHNHIAAPEVFVNVEREPSRPVA